jgi:hypothetical protein
MKRWVWLTIFLYGALLLTLTGPFMLGVTLEWLSPEATNPDALNVRLGRWVTLHFTLDAEDLLGIYAYWAYWLWFGVMLAAQAVLLLVPLDMAERRPQPQRSLLVPIWTTAFLLGNLTLAGLMSLAAGLGGDDFVDWLEPTVVGMAESFQSLRQLPLLSSLMKTTLWNPSEEMMLLLLMGMTGLVLWMIWGLIFYHVAKAESGPALMQRATRWLLRGSILEFLVAVPCHVAVRYRQDCCAVYGTFWGLTMGLSVMLLAFGPGVFFLFAARARRLRKGKTQPSAPSD